MQTRRRSVIEACTNILVGLGLSIVVNYYWLLMEGHEITWAEMTRLGVVMTILSFARSYVLRRIFNQWDK
jgi:hypothetical protein